MAASGSAQVQVQRKVSIHQPWQPDFSSMRRCFGAPPRGVARVSDDVFECFRMFSNVFEALFERS